MACKATKLPQSSDRKAENKRYYLKKKLAKDPNYVDTPPKVRKDFYISYEGRPEAYRKTCWRVNVRVENSDDTKFLGYYKTREDAEDAVRGLGLM